MNLANPPFDGWVAKGLNMPQVVIGGEVVLFCKDGEQAPLSIMVEESRKLGSSYAIIIYIPKEQEVRTGNMDVTPASSGLLNALSSKPRSVHHRGY